MSFDITRQPLSLIITALLLMLVLFWGRHAIVPLPFEDAYGVTAPLARMLDSSWLGRGFAGDVASMLTVFVNALMLIRIGTRNMLYVVKAYLPAPFYLIVSCGIYISSGSLSVQLASMLAIWGLSLIIDGYRRTPSFDECFRGSFLVGLAALICPAYVVAFPVVPFILSVFHRSPREVLVALCGLVLPLVFCSYIYWGMGESFLHVGGSMLDDLLGPSGEMFAGERFGYVRMGTLALAGLQTLLSLVTFFILSRSMRTRPKKIYYAVFLLMAGCAGGLFLPGSGVALFALASIPLSLLMPLFFVRFTGWVPALLYFLVTGTVVALNLAEIVTV